VCARVCDRVHTAEILRGAGLTRLSTPLTAICVAIAAPRLLQMRADFTVALGALLSFSAEAVLPSPSLSAVPALLSGQTPKTFYFRRAAGPSASAHAELHEGGAWYEGGVRVPEDSHMALVPAPFYCPPAPCTGHVRADACSSRVRDSFQEKIRQLFLSRVTGLPMVGVLPMLVLIFGGGGR